MMMSLKPFAFRQRNASGTPKTRASRSRKTAGANVSATLRVPLKAGNKFVSRHGRCPEFADNNGTAVVGNFRRFTRRCLARERKSEERDGGIACPRNVEYLACLSRDVIRCFVFLKKHHAVFAEGDEEVLGFPFCQERFASPPKIDIFSRSLIRFAPWNPGREKSFRTVWFHHRHPTPINRMSGIRIGRDEFIS